MKVKKIISILILLICVSFIFTGCASVNYTTLKYSNGEIIETVECTLNEQLLKNKGYNVNEKKNAISATAYVALQEKYSGYITKITNKYENLIQNKDFENAEIYEELLESVTVYQPVWRENILFCKIHFKTSTAYYMFYNLTEPNFKRDREIKNLFTEKIYFRGNLGYALNNSLYSTLSTRLDLQFMKFSEQDVSLSYSYLAPSRRYHSNADDINVTKDGYLHTWYVREDINQEIYFYVILANRHVWYLLAIVISLFVTFILLVVALIKITLCRKKTLIQTLIKSTKLDN